MTNLDPQLVAAIGSGVVGGGVITGLLNVWSARKKVPVERDSIIVTGAEKAVVALQAVVEAETARADRAESQVAERDAQLARKDERIEALERKLDALQSALDAARDELHQILSSEN